MGQDSFVYLYILPFENTENDPTIEWIAPGLTDMVKQQVTNEFGVKVKFETKIIYFFPSLPCKNGLNWKTPFKFSASDTCNVL